MYQRFIARQPILTSKLSLLGYELLFRAGNGGSAPADHDATARVIGASTMLFHWQSLLGRSLAFVNFGTAELLSGAAYLLPSRLTVVELPSTINATEEVIHACRALRDAKYRIALDDFHDSENQEALVPFADFLKVDFRASSHEDQLRISAKYASHDLALVAKKVETWREFRRAKSLQFRNFQGYFFLEPQLLERRDIASTKANALRLIQAVQASPLDTARLEEILKQEPAFSVKLLRYLNSPIMARQAEITSLPMAIAPLSELPPEGSSL